MQRTNQSTSMAAPSISLPKGGGAIRGIGEKFGTNTATGTGSLSVPLPLSTSRSNFGPELSLSYDSGTGNGPFGLGWSLSLPSITRKTDQGLPQYNDAGDSDVFIISGAEDLVPVLVEEAGQWNRQSIERTVDGVEYRIQIFRPRIEGLFARIERWTNLQTGVIHWRSISRENITRVYGRDNNSRIFDPAETDPENPARIFRWLISESFDDKGNVVVYEYKEENGDAVSLSNVHERNRTATSRSADRYLKRIRYGNRVSRLVNPEAALNDWMFEVVFDYGEHDAENPTPGDDGNWLCRHDPFSSYRAGFEVRTYRLCQRVLMFHHFPDDEAVGQNCLVRSLDFSYRSIRNNPDDLRQGHPIASFLASITQCGYRRRQDGFLRRTMPPLEFEYSDSTIHEELREIELESLENLPYGIDNSQYQWLDLDGEGASGIVSEQEGGWFYKRNLSPLNARQNENVEAVLSPVELITRQPSLGDDDTVSQMFLDLAGDGQVDLVQFGRPVSGYFERSHSNDWSKFVPFESVPSISVDDPNVKFVDLTGDGHADILISEDEVFVWYPSLGEAGFATATKVAQALDEEEGPRLVFADTNQSIYLADFSGDGLTDLVRIRNGEVCYWPNLGYGKFGAKVTMDNAPWFEEPDQFHQRRVLLADIDGSGVTDIIYLGRNSVALYFNQSGNSLSERHSLTQIPATDNLSSVAAIDLLGNGTACLVWSSSLPGNRVRSLRYVDIMGGQKPHLLVTIINNLGAETRIQYAPSTSFYMEDKFAGKPWLTKLPFPVQVVERIETLDRVSRNRFVTRYTYHHGYFDGGEREFRGFGMVEQFDTEELAVLSAEGILSQATNIDPASHVPPVVTRTWFHTGALIDAGKVSRQFEDDYYHEGDPSLGEEELNETQRRSMLLDDTIIPNSIRLPDGTSFPWTITADEALEASRSLKGAVLRQEVYAFDGSEEMDRPYLVSERNYTIAMLQPRESNLNAVFFTHAREKIDFNYERKLFDVNGRMLADPRVSHSMTLAVDGFGNITESVAIAYGRRHRDPNPLLTEPDHQTQQQTLITYTANSFTNAVVEDDSYRTPAPAESRTYELLNVAPAANEPDVTNLFRFEEMLSSTQLVSDGLHDIPYENAFGEGVDTPSRRIIEHKRSLYRHDDLSGPLPSGELQPLAIEFENYELAFTPGLLAQVYGDRVNEEMLANEGGYVHLEDDGNWWIPSGRTSFSQNPADNPPQELTHALESFFLPQRFSDPFGNTTFIIYDSHFLLPVESRNALGSTTVSENDYRVLQPRLITDANGNRTEAVFNALGLVTGTAQMGKENEQLGDSLDNFEPDLDDETIAAHIQDPSSNAHVILGSAGSRVLYDLHAYHRTSAGDNPQPIVIYTLTRETHVSEPLNEPARVQHSFTYSDGFGREIQTKVQAEAGPLIEGEPEVDQRWVGSGWTIFNNKGKPVKQYEPFFSVTHQFEFARTVGVSPLLCYDPVERIVATLHPNHSWEKTVFNPWQQESWDQIDTVLIADPAADIHVGDYFDRIEETEYLPTWHQARIDGALGNEEQSSAQKSAAHANTPATVYFDPLGRQFLSIADNGPDGQFQTRTEQDIRSKTLRIIDARNNANLVYQVVNDGNSPAPGYDLTGRRLFENNMDAGRRWMLADVLDNPIRVWDSRGHMFRNTYDQLRRLSHRFVQTEDEQELLAEMTVYGESHPEAQSLNLHGEVFQTYDSAGVTMSLRFDFKGNQLEGRRQLAREYHTTMDWMGLAQLSDIAEIEAAAAPLLEEEIFTTQTDYDALNRPVAITTPDNSVTLPTYNEASLLERIEVRLRGADEATLFVADIDYNAQGKRERITYATTDGTNVTTTYHYDPRTFLLARLHTVRHGDNRDLQDLNYVYDPVGNITSIRDNAQETVFFSNTQIEPHSDFTYDALYRLIRVEGREHAAQNNVQHDGNEFTPLIGIPFLNNPEALQRYVEEYAYDSVGNILSMSHVGGAVERWRRRYSYAQDSNRLLATSIPGDGVDQFSAPYTHDAHGNMTRMPHLPLIRWDFKDLIQATSRQVVNEGTPETTYYVYDAGGRRVRKVTERQAGEGQIPIRRNERIYLGGVEIYREYNNGGNTVFLERETLHVMTDDRRIALVETRTLGEDDSPAQLTRYQLTNHIDSTLVELDDEANVITYEEFHPYGTAAYRAGRSAVESSLKRYRYAGKENDEESGLNYHGERYYAPWIARWLRVDSLAHEYCWQSPYNYASNNPVNKIDPTGKGAYYSQEGFFLGSDQKKDKNVYVSTKETVEEFTEDGNVNWDKVAESENTINLTEKYNVKHEEFLNRAHWAYGESAGAQEVADHYAHAINNIIKDHKKNPYRSNLYRRHLKRGFFEKGVTPPGKSDGYKRFREFRKDLRLFNSEKNEGARNTIAAAIGAITGSTENPVGQSRFWKGSETALIHLRRNTRAVEKYLKEHPEADPNNTYDNPDMAPEDLLGSEWEILEKHIPPVPNHHYYTNFVYKQTGSEEKPYHHVFYGLTREGKKAKAY
jgi:RHS repeat-associated protein